MERATLRKLGGALLVSAMAAALFLFRDRLPDLLEWVESMGAWAPALIVGVYILACLLFLPGSVITLGAAAVLGFTQGFVAVMVGSNLGAWAAFLVGRTLAREWVSRKVEGNPRFRAIDHAVAQRGFRIVLLLRLSPVFPFNLLNFALGVTKVGFRDYAIASWIGMLPGTVLYVYLGSLARSLAEVFSRKSQPTAAEQALLVFGLVATLAVTVYVTRVARRAMAEAVPGANGAASTGGAG